MGCVGARDALVVALLVGGLVLAHSIQLLFRDRQNSLTAVLLQAGSRRAGFVRLPRSKRFNPPKRVILARRTEKDGGKVGGAFTVAMFTHIGD
jgi:hypothetical protein